MSDTEPSAPTPTNGFTVKSIYCHDQITQAAIRDYLNTAHGTDHEIIVRGSKPEGNSYDLTPYDSKKAPERDCDYVVYELERKTKEQKAILADEARLTKIVGDYRAKQNGAPHTNGYAR